MKFKPWTPTALVEYYHAGRLDIEGTLAHEVYENLSVEAREKLRKNFEKEKNDQSALILKLATHDDMEAVWKILIKHTKRHEQNKYFRQSDPDECEQHMIIELIANIESAILKSKKLHSKRKDDIEKYKSIADAAALLQRLIHNTPLDKPVDQWFSQEVINSIIEKDLDPEKLSGYASFISDEAVGEPLNDSFYKGDIYREGTNSDGVPSHEYFSKIHFFQRFVITEKLPVLSEILGSLVTDAKEIAEATKIEPRLNERSKISPTTIFIRTLYWNFWLNEFGTPLYRTFAALCQVVLDNQEIDKDTVINALRSS